MNQFIARRMKKYICCGDKPKCTKRKKGSGNDKRICRRKMRHGKKKKKKI
jgi:hypothetical protein